MPRRIAVPTNDGKTLFPKMLGMAKFFYIYETIAGDTFTLLEKRANAYETTLQHQKTLDVYALISDCEIIVSTSIGKKGIKRLEEKGMKLVFARGNIEDALQKTLDNEQSRWKIEEGCGTDISVITYRCFYRRRDICRKRNTSF
ncbi:MAG: hypothetical protein JXN60_09515 [Lentisphaerae bacterium]|nr:hypothetical protein [Lentisphaerota bacterium]